MKLCPATMHEGDACSVEHNEMGARRSASQLLGVSKQCRLTKATVLRRPLLKDPMARITHVVYDPPLASLPYLAVVFRPDGTLEVKPFKNARQADAFTKRMARATANAAV
jgi:hypothetical protein